MIKQYLQYLVLEDLIQYLIHSLEFDGKAKYVCTPPNRQWPESTIYKLR